MDKLVDIEKYYSESKKYIEAKCAKILDLDTNDDSGLQKLKLITNDDNKEEGGLYFPECIKRQYDYLYDVMIKHGEIYGGFYEIKDLLEMVIKIPVIIFLYGMTDYIINDGGDGTEDIRKSSFSQDGRYSPKILEFYNIILGKPPAFGDWEVMCAKIAEVEELNKIPVYQEQKDIYLEIHRILKALKGEYTNFSDLNGKKGNVSTYRNDKLGHGATNLEIKSFFEDFKHLLKKLNRILIKTAYSSDIKFFGGCNSLKLQCSNNTLDINPYILFDRNDKAEISLIESFNDVKQDALLLNYINGVKWPNSEIYKKLHFVKERLSIVECTDNDMNAYKISKKDHLASLKLYRKETTVKNSVFLNAINKFLETRRNDMNNGILLLEAERGMGKSVFARLLSGNDDEKISTYQDGGKLKGNKTMLVWSFIANGHYGSTLRGFIHPLIEFVHKNIKERDTLCSVDYDNVYSDMFKISNIINPVKQQELFQRYLDVVIKEFEGEIELVLIIDGLDEINENNVNGLKLADLLRAINLPENVFIVLLGRTTKEYRPIRQFESIADDVIVISRGDTGYHKILYNYVWKFIVNKDLKQKDTDNNNSLCNRILEIADYRFVYVDLIRRMYELLSKYFKINDLLDILENVNSNGTEKNFLKLYLDNMLFIGGKYYNDLLKVLLVIASSPFELTLKNIGYLCFNDNRETFKVKAILNDLMGFVRTQRNFNGEVYALENEIWATELLGNSFSAFRSSLEEELKLRLDYELNKENNSNLISDEVLLLLSIAEINVILSSSGYVDKLFRIIDSYQGNNSIYYHEIIINILGKLIDEVSVDDDLNAYVGMCIRMAYSLMVIGNYKECRKYISDVTKYIDENSEINILYYYLLGKIRILEANMVIQSEDGSKNLAELFKEGIRYLNHCLKKLNEINKETEFEDIKMFALMQLLDSYNEREECDKVNELCQRILKNHNNSRRILVKIFNYMYDNSMRQKYMLDHEDDNSISEMILHWIEKAKGLLPAEQSAYEICDIETLKNLYEYNKNLNEKLAAEYLSKAIDVYESIIFNKNRKGECIEEIKLAELYELRIEFMLTKQSFYDKSLIIQDISNIDVICKKYKDADEFRYWKTIYELENKISNLKTILIENKIDKLVSYDNFSSEKDYNIHFILARECLTRFDSSASFKEEIHIKYLKAAIYHFEKGLGIDRAELNSIFSIEKDGKDAKDLKQQIKSKVVKYPDIVNELIEKYTFDFDGIDYHYPVSIEQVTQTDRHVYIKAAIVLLQVQKIILDEQLESFFENKKDFYRRRVNYNLKLANTYANLGVLLSKNSPKECLKMLYEALRLIDVCKKESNYNIFEGSDEKDIIGITTIGSGGIGIISNDKIDNVIKIESGFGNLDYEIAAISAFKVKVLLEKDGWVESTKDCFYKTKEMLKKIINSNENIQPFNFLVDDSINQLMSMYKSIFREDLINWMKVFKKSDFVNNIVENNNEVSSRFALLDDEYDECIKLAQKHNRGNYMLFAYSCKITNMLFTGRYRTLLETAKGLTTSFGKLLRDRHRDDFYCKDFIGYYRDLIETNIEECKEVIKRLDENKEDIEFKIMQNIYPEYYQKFLAAKDKKLLAEKEYRNYNIMIHTNMSNKPSILEPISYLIYLKNRYSNTERKLKQKFDEMVKANNDFIKIEKDFYNMKDNENVKVQLKAMAQIISDNKSHISDTLLLLQKERNFLGKKKSE